MKKNNILTYITIGASVLMVACKPSLEEFKPTVGEGNDFKKYISVGNSLTAGYADGGLYNEGMQNAYPVLIAEQMKEVGGGEFVTPYFGTAQSNGSGYLKLDAITASGPVTSKVTTGLAITAMASSTINPAVILTEYTNFDISANGLNNFGVPGIKLAHAFPFAAGAQTVGANNYSQLNGYYLRLLGAKGTTPYLDFVLDKGNKNKKGEAEPYTFFSSWLGNNDVLGYASNGADAAIDQLTLATDFGTMYTESLKRLSKEGKIRGVVATIPYVTSVPYFTTVTAKAIIDGATKAAGASFKGVFTADKTTPLSEKDLILLTFPTKTIGMTSTTNPYPYGLHPNNPIEDKYVLTEEEQLEVKTAVDSYNTAIKAAAATYNVALWDANASMVTVSTTGLKVNGVDVNGRFISGGVFSLDGVHLTPRGNAIVANYFIDAINQKYGSKISKINVSKYRGVKLP
ncbi:MAG: G-D-S-L family lipolytic protein [Sphingobacteriaceae bacterium]|nr:G-D-S-L family lipolytic protein [Sphingobacteriaceae bacterium]